MKLRIGGDGEKGSARVAGDAHPLQHVGGLAKEVVELAPASLCRLDVAGLARVVEELAHGRDAATADGRPRVGKDVQVPVADEHVGPIASNLGEERSVQPRAVPHRQRGNPSMDASGETERPEVSDPKLRAGARQGALGVLRDRRIAWIVVATVEDPQRRSTSQALTARYRADPRAGRLRQAFQHHRMASPHEPRSA